MAYNTCHGPQGPDRTLDSNADLTAAKVASRPYAGSKAGMAADSTHIDA